MMRTPEQEEQWQEAVESVAHWLYYRDWDREFTLHFPSGEWFDERIDEYIRERYRNEAEALLKSAIPIAVVDSDQVPPFVNPRQHDNCSEVLYGMQMLIDAKFIKVISKEAL